jgi:hypothetical protein
MDEINHIPANNQEIIAVVQWILNSPPVDVINGDTIIIQKPAGQKGAKKAIVDAVDSYFKSFGIKTIERGGWLINITRSGIGDSIEHGYGRNKINAFAALPKILANGKIVKENKNWNGRGYDSYIIDAPILIDGIDYVAEAILNKYPDGIVNFYLHEVEEKTKLQDALSTSGSEARASIGASKLNLTQIALYVK